MNITVNNVRENALDETVFFTLTDDLAVEYKGMTDVPLTVGDEQVFCNANIERLLLFYRRKEYRKAAFTPAEGQTELEAFDQWTEAGHTNPAHCSKNIHETEQECIDAECAWIPAEVIDKVPFVNSHDYTGTLTDRKLEEICLAVNQYIYAHYDAGAQNSFQAIYVMNSTPVAVKDTLLMVWTWVQSVLVYYYTKKAEIIAASDPASVTWDFSTFDAADPQVSLQSLMI